LGEGLLDPLHDSRKLQSVLRLYVEAEPIILQAQGAYREHEPEPRLPEHLVKEGQSLRAAEQRLPIVDAGAYFIPNALGKFT
jgi:hypothetical protein